MMAWLTRVEDCLSIEPRILATATGGRVGKDVQQVDHGLRVAIADVVAWRPFLSMRGFPGLINRYILSFM